MVQNEFSTSMFPPTPMTDCGYTVEVVTDLKKPPAWHFISGLQTFDTYKSS